jgi:hypothetical protein
MPRKTIIFGNGLGMALDDQAFRLSTAISEVWSDGEFLTDEQRSLISACLEVGVIDEGRPPESEQELDRLQRVLAACDFLRDIDVPDGGHWLTDRGQMFPDAIRVFIHKVAARFHRVGVLPDAFINPLCEFIRDTCSHVATLNYDDLLYVPFVQNGVCRDWRGELVDGVRTEGFSERNLIRYRNNNFGWYLHLHGSPLFYTDADGSIKKIRSANLDRFATNRGHIVLTHVKHKPSVIQSSEILRSYWRHFSLALDESSEVVLFGYSGCDEHLNGLLAARSSRLPIRVVEWDGNGCADMQPEIRSSFWEKVLNSERVKLIQMPKILDFADWDGAGG